MAPDTVIIIPTYNEAESIVPLIEELTRVRSELLFDLLIVDDNSPDKTADLIESLNIPWIRVLNRSKKDGLGAAYRAGFSEILNANNYQKIVTMDGDGSHLVADLPKMLAAAHQAKTISSKYLVLGTRWIEGGEIRNWSKLRIFISKTGTRYARKTLAIELQDLTSGYRIYSCDLLKTLNLENLKATGYCFQIEMAAAANYIGAEIVEVPITFIERRSGKSKMGIGIVLEALLQTTLWGLRRTLRPNADNLHYVR